MISRLLISPDTPTQIEAARKLISDLGLKDNHPDVLWFEPSQGKKIGVEDTKSFREHFSLKPYSASGLCAVIIGADNLTTEGQNSLLKTIEEPPESASFILTASSESNLLPTILSRVQITFLDSLNSTKTDLNGQIEKLISSGVEERFQMIEKYDQKEELLEAIGEYLKQNLPKNPNLLSFAESFLETQRWSKAQGNTRAILEYLMLNLP